MLSRRQFVCTLFYAAGMRHALAQTHPLDAIAVYLVPLDDFPEDLAQALANALRDDTRQRVKASLRLPPLRVGTLPGSNQLIAEDVLAEGAKASARIPDMTEKTFRMFLTTKDINSRSANFRFMFSMHNRDLNCSVISFARLIEYIEEKPVVTRRALVRLIKLSKRAIGEMYLGWKRSTDPSDIMFAPLMSVDDLDRMQLQHADEDARELERPPVRANPSNSV